MIVIWAAAMHEPGYDRAEVFAPGTLSSTRYTFTLPQDEDMYPCSPFFSCTKKINRGRSAPIWAAGCCTAVLSVFPVLQDRLSRSTPGHDAPLGKHIHGYGTETARRASYFTECGPKAGVIAEPICETHLALRRHRETSMAAILSVFLLPASTYCEPNY